MEKLYNKKAIALMTGVTLSLFLNACAPSKTESTNEASSEQITEYYQENEQEETNETVETQNELENIENETSEERADRFTEEYITDLKQEFSELSDYASEKWNSEEAKQKREQLKEKVTILINFVFNGGEINGITFSELSEEGKANVMNSVSEVDGLIDAYIPDYKERFHSWLVDKGADLKDTWEQLKEDWHTYKEEVESEYSSRATSKTLRLGSLK